ncbi:MAG: hypothetical protein NT070_19530 [Cyanobacteria bacterium]|nr:hypothetical protein [Cyanobacteriota bacterium]
MTSKRSPIPIVFAFGSVRSVSSDGIIFSLLDLKKLRGMGIWSDRDYWR